MIVLGLDPSMTCYGWALVEIGLPRSKVLLAGCVRTEKDAKKRHLFAADQDALRIQDIARELNRVLDPATNAAVQRVVCEAPAGSQHANAAKALGQSLGVTIGVLVARERSVRFVQAHEVKLAVGGGKAASKDDVAKGVERLTGWTSSAKTAPAREAESDAAAVALTLRRELLEER